MPERDFNTLASRNNTMNLQAGERIGYRGHTQYNETYDDQEPSVMDNPQPLTHMTYKQNELELNVAGKCHPIEFPKHFSAFQRLKFIFGFYQTFQLSMILIREPWHHLNLVSFFFI